MVIDQTTCECFELYHSPSITDDISYHSSTERSNCH